jgi:hypothetical protein
MRQNEIIEFRITKKSTKHSKNPSKKEKNLKIHQKNYKIQKHQKNCISEIFDNFCPERKKEEELI